MGGAIRSAGAVVSGAIYDRGRRKSGQQERVGIREATDTSIQARNASLNTLSQETDRQRGYWTPQYEAGQRGMEGYERTLTGLEQFRDDPSQMQESAAYQFRMQQGTEAVNRSYAARGGLGGGGRAMALTDYAQGLASTEYDAEYQRRMGILGAYGDMAQFGERAANQLTGISQNYASSFGNLQQIYSDRIGGLQMGHASSQAAQTMDRANNWAAVNMYAADQGAGEFDRFTGGGGK